MLRGKSTLAVTGLFSSPSPGAHKRREATYALLISTQVTGPAPFTPPFNTMHMGI